MIIDLRFILRDGKMVLQMHISKHSHYDEEGFQCFKCDWQDVPTVEGVEGE